MISNDAAKIIGNGSRLVILLLGTFFVGSMSIAAPAARVAAPVKPASPPLLVSAAPRGGMQAPRVLTGFSDSSFDYGENMAPENKTFCYIGDRRGICPLLLTAARRMQERYREGAHDTMVLEACGGETGFADVIRARYRLTDDYGGNLRVNRLIPPCETAAQNPEPDRLRATPL